MTTKPETTKAPRKRSAVKSIPEVLRAVAGTLDSQAMRAYGARNRELADSIQELAVRCTELATKAE